MRHRTALTTSLSFAAGLALVTSSPQEARAETIPFDKLPVLTLPAAASTPEVPEKIPATEHAGGLFAVLPPLADRKSMEESGYHYVHVYASEREAQQMAAKGRTETSSDDETAPRQCIASGSSFSPHLSFYVRTKPYMPPKPSQAEIARLVKLHRWPPPPPKVEKGPHKDRVELIRSERVVQTPEAVTIETTEAFVDLETMGTRAVGTKTSQRLTRVGSGPNEIGIFAARDDKGKSVFLVTNPQIPATSVEEDRQAQLQGLRSTANRLVAQMPGGGSSETGCGYVRFTLTAKPGSGQMATVLATAFLPPSGEPDESATTEEQFESTAMTEEQMKSIREMVHRQNRAQRARPVAINVSLSQLESENAPLLSVTLGWAGGDQKLRF
jgi:hypothetical protein